MKKTIIFLKKHWANLLFSSFLVYIVLLRAPSWIQSFNAEGQWPGTVEVQSLGEDKVMLPIQGSQLLVFWATWCPPCKVELSRIQNLINLKKIDKNSVKAVSVGEELKTVKEEVEKRGYTFDVYVDPMNKSREIFHIEATPTLILINKENKVDWKTSGLSPTLELRLLSGLNAPTQ